MHIARIAKIALVSTLAVATTTEAFAIDASATQALNVRTGPGTGYNVLDTLYAGEIVDVTECNGNGWCFVNRDGPTGWVSANYLSKVNYGTAQGGWNEPAPVQVAPPVRSYTPPPAPRSSSDDAAGALAFAAILGIGAVMIGSAIASNDNQQNNRPTHSSTYGSRGCQPGLVWSRHQHACVVR